MCKGPDVRSGINLFRLGARNSCQQFC